MKPSLGSDPVLTSSIRGWPLLGELAKRSGVTQEQAQRVLAALASLAAERLACHRGSFALPGVLQARTRTVEPRPDRPGKNPFTGEAMTIRGRRGSHQILVALAPALKALERKDIPWRASGVGDDHAG